MKKRLTWLCCGGVVLLAALQLANPRLTNPPLMPGADLMATNPPPPQIAALLHNACYDCHSNQTTWPWYSHFAPVSWFLVDHVQSGRRHLNFSEWPHGHPLREMEKWRHVFGQVRSGKMPLTSYTWMHPAARLSAAQRKELVAWLQQQINRLQNE